MKTIAGIQDQISELRATFDALNTNPAPTHHPRENRSEEVVVCELGHKSKEEAINLIQTIVQDKAGDTYMMKEKTSQVSQVVPVKFAPCP